MSNPLDENSREPEALDRHGNRSRLGMDSPSGDTETRSFATDAQSTPRPIVELPLVRIGRYRIERELGKGAFGRVYAAFDESLNRTVAIKILTRFGTEADLQGWLAEARTLASLDHAAIVPVYDVGRTENGVPFIVSKFINGGSLEKQLKSVRPAIVDSVRIAITVAQALGYAHEQRFVHRDIKPANILMTADGAPVVADFGLALHETGLGKGPRFVGTPAYMSPEQARLESHRVDGRSDIFSLGAVLYEMLTGHRVFSAHGHDELLECIKTVEVRPPRQWNREISRELDRICLKALSKRPSDRYSTAFDFAEELQNYLSELEVPPPVPGPVPATAATASDSNRDRPSHGSRSQQPAVIPRGLRPFDAADADFFPFLLPGPRDRDGLPESIRFWRNQIAQRDPAATFRVGVLLGPSGSGKSSLVRAGVLPHLPSRVITLIVESRPDRLGSHLLKRLVYLFPALSQAATLHEAFTILRQGQVLEPDQKFLLVLDQFEQWLNRAQNSAEDDLLEALRQCDGSHLQALLVARDDFTIPLTRFMDDLEEPLRQNHNFATVDRFGREHARQVLTAFGRAYGVFPEAPTAEQQKFISMAVDELETDGQLVPVRLALFADIVKDRPWDGSTLRKLGGARGVGIKFLEERIMGPGANPAIRSRVDLIKRLLIALLPGEEEQIKAPARTLSELRQALGEAEEASLEETLTLLDVELRLVTPRASSASEGNDSARSDSSREPSYQLTHDFLVSSIRAWLESEERMTRGGRAKLRLRQLAEAWGARPEPRRLPTLGEWLSIRWSTSPHQWSLQESRLMRTAARRFTRGILCGLGAVLALALIGSQIFAWWQAGMLSDRLLNADTAEVNSILQQMQPYSRWTEPRLRHLAAEHESESSSKDDRARRRRLNLSLALADSDPRFLSEIVDRLPTVPVEHLQYVREHLSRHAVQVRPLLRQQLESELAASKESALAFGAVLLGVADPTEEFNTFAPALAKLLAGARTVHLAEWAHLYEPLAPKLLPELIRLYERESMASSPTRTNLTELLAVYAKDDTPHLLTAIKHSLPHEIPVLLADPPHDSLAFQSMLRQLLETNHGPPQGDEQTRDGLAPIPETLKRDLEKVSGAIDSESAWAPAISHVEFERLNPQLSALGFAVRCLRPLETSEEMAVIWRRDQKESRVERDLTVEEARNHVQDLQTKGWELIDFATKTDPNRLDDGRWTLVWQKTAPPPDTVRVFLDRPGEDPEIEDEWSEAGYALMRHDVRIDPEGKALYSAIWRKSLDGDTKSEVKWRYAKAFGDLRPGKVQTDIRSHSLRRQVDRLALREDYLGFAESLRRHQHTSTNKADGAVSAGDVQRIYAARALSELGDSAAAESMLADVVKRRPNSAEIRESMGVIYARARKLEELRGEISFYERFKTTGKRESLTFLRLLEAVLAKDEAAARSQLAELEQKKEEQDYRVRYTRGLAILTGASELGALAEEAAGKLLPALEAYHQSDSSPSLVQLLSSVDFDHARTRPEIAKFLVEGGFTERLHSSYFEHRELESRQLHSLPRTQHRYEAERLTSDGFTPVAMDTHVPAGAMEPVCSSVWLRPARDVVESILTARQHANLVFASALSQQTDPLFGALRGRWGRDVRSQVTVHSAKIIPPRMLIDRLLRAESQLDEVTHAILLSLGEFSWPQLPGAERAHLVGRLQSWANSAEDPGVQAAAKWCLRRWGQETLTAAAAGDPANSLWYRNSLGQIMIVVRPTGRFLMGSPPTEIGHASDEPLHWARVRRTIAVADTEVTEKQFQIFLQDPRVQSYYKRDAFKPRGAEKNVPQRDVTWLDAARFCQWLSEREGILKAQWCYPSAWDRATTSPPPPAPQHLSLGGYRLPTEMEWEYIARAGGTDAYHFGADESLLSAYDWVGRNSGGGPHPVALLRPNRWGFFDTLGNVSEWCDDRGSGYVLPDDDPVRTDGLSETDQGKPESPNRNVRGGRYGSAATSCRCAARLAPVWDTTSTGIGFRVVRTIPPNP